MAVAAAAETPLAVLEVPVAVAMVDILLQVEQAHPDRATMAAQAPVVLQPMPQAVVVVQALWDLLLRAVALAEQAGQAQHQVFQAHL